MKKTILIDHFWTGHHPTYLKLFSKAILSCGHSVVVFCPSPHEVQQWIAVNCPHDRERFRGFEIREPARPRFLPSRMGDALYGAAWWLSAAGAVRKAHRETGTKPDLVFFAWLDSYLGFFQGVRPVDLIFPYPWAGLYFHPRHLRSPDISPEARGYDGEIRSVNCRGVALLDEGVADRMRVRFPGKPVVVFPDVADQSAPDRGYPVLKDLVERAAGRKIVSLLGGLAKRKGMLTLLEAARLMAPDECLFSFCGVLAEQAFAPEEAAAVRQLAADPPRNCFFHFGRIPDEAQFNALVERSDVLFAGYENFPHSSNILTKAALFEKPVLVSRGSCMEERVRTFGLGTSFDTGDVAGCVAGLRRLLEGKDLKADFSGFRATHSPERFEEAMGSILAAAALPPDPTEVTTERR